MNISDKPLASNGLISYRYKGPFGWVMIGANNHSGALREAARSVDFTEENLPQLSMLQMWNGKEYADITGEEGT